MVALSKLSSKTSEISWYYSVPNTISYSFTEQDVKSKFDFVVAQAKNYVAQKLLWAAARDLDRPGIFLQDKGSAVVLNHIPTNNWILLPVIQDKGQYKWAYCCVCKEVREYNDILGVKHRLLRSNTIPRFRLRKNHANKNLLLSQFTQQFSIDRGGLSLSIINPDLPEASAEPLYSPVYGLISSSKLRDVICSYEVTAYQEIDLKIVLGELSDYSISDLKYDVMFYPSWDNMGKLQNECT